MDRAHFILKAKHLLSLLWLENIMINVLLTYCLDYLRVIEKGRWKYCTALLDVYQVEVRDWPETERREKEATDEGAKSRRSQERRGKRKEKRCSVRLSTVVCFDCSLLWSCVLTVFSMTCILHVVLVLRARRPPFCNIGGLWSRSATTSGNRHMAEHTPNGHKTFK